MTLGAESSATPPPMRPRIAQAHAPRSFVRNEFAFGYNRADDIPASEVLTDGYGRCNTKGTLLIALLRGVGIRCRPRGITIHEALQRSDVPEFVHPLAPSEILHSWVEVDLGDVSVNLEGFILDAPFLHTLQQEFSGTDTLCGHRVGTENLGALPVAWTGNDTYIQKAGIVRHWMNARVRAIRRGVLRRGSGLGRPGHSHKETNRAA